MRSACFTWLLLLQWGRAIVRAQAADPPAPSGENPQASMGARDCTRASAAAPATTVVPGQLQWGRAIVRAQALRVPLRECQRHRFNGGARLYARKRNAFAEQMQDVIHASMGARDCTRASVDAAVGFVSRDVTLQWGRAIVRAQAARRSRPGDVRHERFNGGARLYARKLDPHREVHRQRIEASMGARDCTRASHPVCGSALRRMRRFNGGARLYARKQPESFASAGVDIRASMGARDCTRASGSYSARYTRLEAASMGARDCTRASGGNTQGFISSWTRLQWGRAIVRAQAGSPRTPRRTSIESFNGGARLYARKRDDDERAERAGLQASNGGARLYARKRSRYPCWTRRLGMASMGARDCTRASAGEAQQAAAAALGFNGGARLYARKRSSTVPETGFPASLQWGRAIVRAQARRPWPHRARRREASMGARDCTRASSAPSPPTSRRSRLQWGRAIVRAQARSRSPAPVPGNEASMGARDCTRASAAAVRRRGPADDASMGARDCTRASLSTSIRRPTKLRCFNGGARLYARKRRRRCGGCRPPCRSFNGGARLYARKLGRLVVDLAALFEASMGARDCTRASFLDTAHKTFETLLQWGRAIVRAQATRNLVKYTSESQKLQWGRAIVRAQAARRRKQRHARRPCFNGGARLYARKLEALGRRVPGAN